MSGICRLKAGNLPELRFHPGGETLQSDPLYPSPLWKDLAQYNSTFPLLSEQLLFPQSCADDGQIFLAAAVNDQLHLCVVRHATCKGSIRREGGRHTFRRHLLFELHEAWRNPQTLGQRV